MCGRPVLQQQVQPRQQISTAQLRQILQRNQLPDGRELSPQMRSVLHQKLNGSQAALQRGTPAACPPCPTLSLSCWTLPAPPSSTLAPVFGHGMPSLSVRRLGMRSKFLTGNVVYL